MKLQRTKRGFTLIELLVVITIIGILATGAVTVYTSQIQKARDSTRLTDIKALQQGVEQYYQDNAAYPPKSNAFSGVTAYTPKLPRDPKSGQASGNSAFDYLYSISADANTVAGQEFELSTTFEQQGNIDNKAAIDGGNDPFRMEVGIDLNDALGAGVVKPTVVAAFITGVTLDCALPAGGTATQGQCSTIDNPLVVKGN